MAAHARPDGYTLLRALAVAGRHRERLPPDVPTMEQDAKTEPESRADFARFVAADTMRWTRIARAANVQIE